MINSTTGREEVTQERIAKNAWFQDWENEHVKLLSRRVEYMTSLTTDTAEQLQVAYYSTGGLYEPHFDFAIVSTKEKCRFSN